MALSAEKKIHVMRVIARMNLGGPAWQVSVLTEGLEDDRYSTTLVTGSVDDIEGDFIQLRRPDLPHTVIEGLGRSINLCDDLRAFIRLVRLMRASRPDIVHTHTAKAGFLGRLAAICARVPVRVHTFHGHLLTGYFSPLKTFLIIMAEKCLARFTTHLVAVGDKVRSDLLGAGIGRTENFSVIPPGVEVETGTSQPDVRRSVRQSLSLPEGKMIVLFVGRLTEVKRPDRFVDAARLVLAECPDVMFLVCGDGNLGPATVDRARDLGTSITFLGWRGDVNRILSVADVVVLTSDNEGMPVALIESAAAGVPCVTTDVGSAAEVVLDELTGMVVGVDPSEIAQAILSIIRNDVLRANMARNARVRARESFSTERLVAEHRRLYRSLVEVRGRQRSEA